MNASNMTFEERIKYGNITRQDVLDMIDTIRAECDAKIQHVQSLERTDEVLREQIGFARDLLDGIVEIVSRETRSPKAIKEGVLTLLADSYFER